MKILCVALACDLLQKNLFPQLTNMKTFIQCWLCVNSSIHIIHTYVCTYVHVFCNTSSKNINSKAIGQGILLSSLLESTVPCKVNIVICLIILVTFGWDLMWHNVRKRFED